MKFDDWRSPDDDGVGDKFEVNATLSSTLRECENDWVEDKYSSSTEILEKWRKVIIILYYYIIVLADASELQR